MNKLISWILIFLFIFLFVNQIYLNIKKSSIKEGIENNDYKTEIYANKNNIEQVQNEVNKIGQLINTMQTKSINNLGNAGKQSRDIDKAVENKKKADEEDD